VDLRKSVAAAEKAVTERPMTVMVVMAVMAVMAVMVAVAVVEMVAVVVVKKGDQRRL
jgi:anaerobic C4-dicarboxylate transporter